MQSKFSEPDRRHPQKGRERGRHGRPAAEAWREQATFLKWRGKYGGATVSDVKRLGELVAENSKLKRMYAELALEKAAIKDVLSRKL